MQENFKFSSTLANVDLLNDIPGPRLGVFKILHFDIVVISRWQFRLGST
jgi:hypothetical protein